jgi:predicted nucleic acid-binding protein
VLDTVVFSALGVRGREELRDLYRGEVEGRRVVLSFQTVAELRFGARNAGWGDRRRAELEERISAVAVRVADDRLTRAYAELKWTLKTMGHALWHKQHDGDRWIAVTALAHGLPLVTHDGGFTGVPGLTMISKSGA